LEFVSFTPFAGKIDMAKTFTRENISSADKTNAKSFVQGLSGEWSEHGNLGIQPALLSMP